MLLFRLVLLKLLLSVLVLLPVTGWSQEENVRPGINQYYQNPDFNHWLTIFENPRREIFAQRHAIVQSLGLNPGMSIADIGSGTGLFTVMFAREVGPKGSVYAVDIAEEFVQKTLVRVHDNDMSNVQGIVNEPKSVNLPANSIDVAFICDTYHHFEYPLTTMQSIHDALKPGGKLVVIDFKRIPKFSTPWVMGHVRADKQSVIEEIESKGFKFTEEVPLLQRNYFLRFTKQ